MFFRRFSELQVIRGKVTMEGSGAEVGLVTNVDGCMVHIWLMKAKQEKLFTTVENESLTLSVSFKLDIEWVRQSLAL